ncbi:unnamed protein product [Mytilus edulis]|uniref:Uncharacterized protein n=1 Tax=Mytilus edulis TaxID=6550 RepID=A0A8S3U2N4_MYTED|nr:unnamed protein product [Mytilus edulis]
MVVKTETDLNRETSVRRKAQTYSSGNRRKVNLLTSDGKLQKQLPIPGEAWSVTQINQNTIAITYPEEKAIKIFNMENETVTKVITLDKECRGLSFSNNSLAVGLIDNEIRIIDLEGNTLKSIQVKCEYYLSNLVYCNDRVIYSDYDGNAVYCVDGSGKQIWQYTQDLSGPEGLCTDTYGNIIVADRESNRIIVISKDGQDSKVLISEENGLKNPLCTETWLDPNIKSSEIIPDYFHYDTERRDRPKDPHGGVLIAAKQTLQLGNSDHDIVLLDMACKPLKPKPVRRKIFLWKKAEIHNIKEDLQNFITTFKNIKDRSVESLWQAFKTAVQTTIEKRVPTKMTLGRNTHPWINTTIRRKINQKQKAHKKARKTKKKRDKDRYKRLQQEVQWEVRQANKKYMEEVSSDYRDNAKKFWSYIKSKAAAEMSDFECDDNETPQLLKPRDESPDREIMFRRNIGPSGSGTAGDDDEAGQGDVPIRDEYRGVGENFYRKEYQLGPNQRDLPDRNQNIRGNNPDFDNQIPTGFPRGNTSGTTIKPEPYNGKDSWEEYISHFENCADLGRWKESEKVLLLAASLRGPARTFYISLTSTEKKSYCLLQMASLASEATGGEYQQRLDVIQSITNFWSHGKKCMVLEVLESDSVESTSSSGNEHEQTDVHVNEDIEDINDDINVKKMILIMFIYSKIHEN